MVKIIQRTTDKKYLQSVETDTWVDNIKDAFNMSYRECENTKEALLLNYNSELIKEIVDFSKSKPITKEEKKELRNLLKRN